MNREIKFRAKDHTNNHWLYGNLATDKTGLYVILPIEDWGKGDTVFEETIGQFTGLHDKNGEKIYEGDIVRSCEYKNIKHIVSYDDKVAAFVAVCIDENTGTNLETKCHITQEWIDNYPKEVVGNIYDNKELLEE